MASGIGLASTAVSCFIRSSKQKLKSSKYLNLDLTDLNKTTEDDQTTLRLLGNFMHRRLGDAYFMYADTTNVSRLLETIKEKGADWKKDAATDSMAATANEVLASSGTEAADNEEETREPLDVGGDSSDDDSINMGDDDSD